MNHIVISFLCPDRPGVVDQISAIIKAHHGNWQTSSMNHLSGFFAGVIEIAVESNQSDNVIAQLKTIPNLQMLHGIATPTEQVANSLVLLELTANDRSGIINDISSVIHHQGGNLIKLVSKQQSAAHSGQIMFKAKARVDIAKQSVDDLVSALENIADDLMVDVSYK